MRVRKAQLVPVCVALLLTVAGAFRLMAQESERSLAEAYELLESGAAEAAETAFRRLLIDDPNAGEVLIGWARSLAAQGRGREALAPLLQGAERRMARDLDAEAVALLEAATEIDPSSLEIQQQLARGLIQLRRYDAAEEPLRMIVERGGRDPRWLLQLAGVLWEKGNLGEAEELYRETVDVARGTHVAWYQLGRFLLWRGRYPESAEALQRAKLLGSGGFAFELDRSRALEGWAKEAADDERQEVLQQALEAFRLAVELAPEHSGARYGLARVLSRLGRTEEAGAQLEVYRQLQIEDEARTRQKGLNKARLDHALDLLRRAQPAEAREVLESLPETVEVLRALALAYRSEGDLQAAIRSLERAVSLEPRRTDLRTLLTELSMEVDENG